MKTFFYWKWPPHLCGYWKVFPWIDAIVPKMSQDNWLCDLTDRMTEMISHLKTETLSRTDKAGWLTSVCFELLVGRQLCGILQHPLCTNRNGKLSKQFVYLTFCSSGCDMMRYIIIIRIGRLFSDKMYYSHTQWGCWLLGLGRMLFRLVAFLIVCLIFVWLSDCLIVCMYYIFCLYNNIICASIKGGGFGRMLFRLAGSRAAATPRCSVNIRCLLCFLFVCLFISLCYSLMFSLITG